MKHEQLFAVLIRFLSLLSLILGLFITVVGVIAKLIGEAAFAEYLEKLATNPEHLSEFAYHDTYFVAPGAEPSIGIAFLVAALLLYFLANPLAKFFTKGIR